MDSPVNGETSVTRAPPLTVVPARVCPVAGSNQSAEKFCCAAERSTVTEPPEGKYTRYSAPGFIRQYPVEHARSLGVIAARLSI